MKFLSSILRSKFELKNTFGRRGDIGTDIEVGFWNCSYKWDGRWPVTARDVKVYVEYVGK